ncbi:MAG: PQQ-binding-like beta-propeller repeat protein [Pirellulales bacterium]
MGTGASHDTGPSQTSAWYWRRWFVIPLGAVAVLIVGAGVLHVVFGARVYMVGSARPRIEFFSRTRHDHLLEAHREAQHNEPTPSLPAPADVDPHTQWPAFRGPQRDGVVRSGALALPWPEDGPKLLWRQPIGGGHGSFSIHAGRAYTLEQRGEQEVVACYALADGQELWTHRDEAHFQETMGGPGPRSTPTVDADRVYALGATGVLNCLDAVTGQALWTTNILADAQADNVHWGMAGSPLVYGDLVIVAPGGPVASVIAYDKHTGKPVWTGGTHTAGYSSPMLATLAGRMQLLVLDGESLTAYSPDDGAVLWHFPWPTYNGINASQPIGLDENRVFISSGYGQGAALLRVTAADDRFQVEPVWSNKVIELKFTSALLHEGYVYGLDQNILTCVNPETGKRAWKGGRYGFGQLILAGGFLIIQCEDGDLALVEATPEAHRELSRVAAIEGRTWNHPALADGKLLVRNDREMACFDLSAP